MSIKIDLYFQSILEAAARDLGKVMLMQQFHIYSSNVSIGHPLLADDTGLPTEHDPNFEVWAQAPSGKWHSVRVTVGEALCELMKEHRAFRD